MTAIINGFRGKTHTLLGVVKYNPGKSSSVKFFQDIVCKEVILVAVGSISAVFPAAAPKLQPLGVMDGIIEEISVSRRGSDRVKALKGTRKMIHNNERVFGSRDADIYKVNSANLSGTVSFGVPTLGTTGQNTRFQESKALVFENKLSGNWALTNFDTMGLNTAQLNIQWANVANLQDPDDAAAVTSWAHDIDIYVYASCADYALGSKESAIGDWIETAEELSFSGVQTGQKYFITPEGMLQGMLITGFHSGNKLIDFEMMRNTKMEFRYLGTVLAEGSIADFAEIDNQKTYLGERRKGSAYLNFMQLGDFRTGLQIGENKQIEVTIYTDPAINYATPHRIRFEYDQIKFDNNKIAEIKKAA